MLKFNTGSVDSSPKHKRMSRRKLVQSKEGALFPFLFLFLLSLPFSGELPKADPE